MTGGWVLGVDSGGSGLRTALARADAATPPAADAPRTTGAPPAVGRTSSPEPVRTSASGIDAGHLLEQLLPAARSLLADAGGGHVDAACVGAAGMATLGEELREKLPSALADALGVRRLALAADAVTGYAGALGERPGAVVAAGTGMIVVGTDLRSWRRADGWGHLLGDCGGGAWIGRAGLEAAMRAHDGREGGSTALRERAERMFGPLTGLPGQLYPRTDRPAVLAAFAPEVIRCAGGESEGSPDPVAAGIVRRAAAEIAMCAAAACPATDSAPAPAAPAARPEVALTGGLFRSGAVLLEPVREELAVRLPHARAAETAGDPLDGALLIASRLSTDSLRLPPDPSLLTVS
ncbi:ATPase [Streptomyces armeniacus]|uniref:ATPase n=1 Tax=Streptomyces armeniacus TaxID=83291 RepID=A0A345XK14_9ACTN|nr:BadF/BadG/BcrA/BcrD ATPase family protein [Streptomyces armeniacus]AXK31980.1 ATPase [Streptomyces armeniacus]